MATPAIPAINPDEFNCETPECPNPFRFISLFVGDSAAHYHCPTCFVGWTTAIVTRLVEMDEAAASAAEAATAGT